MTFYRFLFEF